MKRFVIPELLDTDSGSAAEIAGSLTDLRMFNNWFGGIATMSTLVRAAARQTGRRQLSLLDVAGAEGFLPDQVSRRLAPEGIRLEYTVLDRSAAHLDGRRPAIAAEAGALPFREASFDLVSSSLFVHHLEPEELVRFVDESLRVARIAVLVHDLRRAWVHLALAYAGLPLYRSRLTRHDAPASVRRAYTPAEFRQIVSRSRAARVELENHYLYRMGAIVWKQGLVS
jgi:ubiquinone/menaquinone biosynthesis C-methylase UbiE